MSMHTLSFKRSYEWTNKLKTVDLNNQREFDKVVELIWSYWEGEQRILHNWIREGAQSQGAKLVHSYISDHATTGINDNIQSTCVMNFWIDGAKWIGPTKAVPGSAELFTEKFNWVKA